jgi:hypothetical protein
LRNQSREKKKRNEGERGEKKIDKITLVVKVQEPSTRVFFFFRFESAETCGGKILQKRKKRNNNQPLIETLKV